MMLMRTTLTIDDSIMNSAKRQAANEGRPLKDVIGDALRLGLAMLAKSQKSRGKFKLTMVDGRGVRPGVKLDDRNALFDLLDGR